MNKKDLEERISLLETEKEQARNTVMAYEGALQDCKYWLAQLEIETNDS